MPNKIKFVVQHFVWNIYSNLIEVGLEVRNYLDRQTYFSSILSFHAVCANNV